MGCFTHNGITFYYEISGEGEPLILLHGLGGDLNQPRGLIEPITNIQLVFLDQRAHGKTNIDSLDQTTFDHLADDVIALADHLGFETFRIGGISMGAAVSVNLAIRYPDRIKALVLIRCAWIAAPMEETYQLWYRELAWHLKHSDYNVFCNSQVFAEIKEKSPQTGETFSRLFGEQASLQYPGKYAVIPRQQPFRNSSDLEKITVPALILFNAKDPIHAYEYGAFYKKHILSSAAYEVTSKVDSSEKHKEEVNQYIRDFLT